MVTDIGDEQDNHVYDIVEGLHTSYKEEVKSTYASSILPYWHDGGDIDEDEEKYEDSQDQCGGEREKKTQISIFKHPCVF